MSTAEILAELPRLSPDDLAKVRATLDALTTARPSSPARLAEHPAIGLWRDRTDLPLESVAASERLRNRLMGRTDSPTP